MVTADCRSCSSCARSSGLWCPCSVEAGVLSGMPGAMAGDVDAAEVEARVEALVEALVDRRPPRVACLVVLLFGLAVDVFGIMNSMIVTTRSVTNGAGWTVPVTSNNFSERQLAE